MKLEKFATHVQLTDEQLPKYHSILKMLQKERELQPSDLDAIAMLVVQMSVFHKCMNIIEVEGIITYSHTQHGQVAKANPANDMMNKAQVAIRGLMEQLLMTPKTKASIFKPEPKREEEFDPIKEYMKKRTQTKGL